MKINKNSLQARINSKKSVTNVPANAYESVVETALAFLKSYLRASDLWKLDK